MVYWQMCDNKDQAQKVHSDNPSVTYKNLIRSRFLREKGCRAYKKKHTATDASPRTKNASKVKYCPSLSHKVIPSFYANAMPHERVKSALPLSSDQTFFRNIKKPTK